MAAHRAGVVSSTVRSHSEQRSGCQQHLCRITSWAWGFPSVQGGSVSPSQCVKSAELWRCPPVSASPPSSPTGRRLRNPKGPCNLQPGGRWERELPSGAYLPPILSPRPLFSAFPVGQNLPPRISPVASSVLSPPLFHCPQI